MIVNISRLNNIYLTFKEQRETFLCGICGDVALDFEARNDYLTEKVVPGERRPEIFDKYPNIY